MNYSAGSGPPVHFLDEIF